MKLIISLAIILIASTAFCKDAQKQFKDSKTCIEFVYYYVDLHDPNVEWCEEKEVHGLNITCKLKPMGFIVMHCSNVGTLTIFDPGPYIK